MEQKNPQIKNLYVPLICIGTGLILMVVDVLFIKKGAYNSLFQGLLIGVVVKAVSYVLVMALGLLLCSWFGHIFEPFSVSLLQLTGVALLAGTWGNTIGTMIGWADPYLIIIVCLGLLGFFFSDDAVNALIAMFLLCAGHSIVTFVLLPMARAFLA